MTVTLQAELALNGTEEIGASTNAPVVEDSGVSSKLQLTKYNVTGSLDGSSTPPLDVSPVDLSVTLTGGTDTIDLTAAPLARDNSLTADLTSGKLVAIQVQTPSTNVGVTTVAPGSADPYDLFGGTATFHPNAGQTKLNKDTTNIAEVSATAKNVDISGSAGDQINIIAYFTQAG